MDMQQGLVWRKSTFSDDTGGACVEVAFPRDGAGIRDSKNPGGPSLRIDRSALAGLVSRAHIS